MFMFLYERYIRHTAAGAASVDNSVNTSWASDFTISVRGDIRVQLFKGFHLFKYRRVWGEKYSAANHNLNTDGWHFRPFPSHRACSADLCDLAWCRTSVNHFYRICKGFMAPVCPVSSQISMKSELGSCVGVIFWGECLLYVRNILKTWSWSLTRGWQPSCCSWAPFSWKTFGFPVLELDLSWLSDCPSHSHSHSHSVVDMASLPKQWSIQSTRITF